MLGPRFLTAFSILDQDLVVEVLSRHGVNVSDAAGEMGVASADLRRLLWAKPQLTDAAVELEERRLDLAEKNIYEALQSMIRADAMRQACSPFATAIALVGAAGSPPSTSAAELSVTANAPARTLTFRWRTSEDDERDAEAAEAERLREEGKPVVSIGWGDGGSDKTIEHEPNPRPSSED